MFKKSERLSRSEFAVYFKTGKRHHFPDCTIITSPALTRKVAVVVGKKVSKRAVVRNTVRRRVYAALYKVLQTTSQTETVIIIVKPTYSTLSRAAADVIVSKSIAQVIKST
ncbi:MAG: Ribonuclease [Candidatus Parcubacteria bacterium]|jgi:ribonuclease P protein component